MRHGGTIYIDAGKPIAGRFAQTLENLRDISPTVYLNVPLAYDMLANAMEKDDALCKSMFAELEMLFYAGAALPGATRKRFVELSTKEKGSPVPFVTSWGTTETAPLVTVMNFETKVDTNVGIPAAGCEVKLTPIQDRFELRVKGPNVTTGYWRDPERTSALFDEDGYYRSGDAAKLVDEANPAKGILFDGRVAEDFKLSSGTWVPVGKVRMLALDALRPVAQDVVVLGQDWDWVALLVFADHEGCVAVTGELPCGNELGLIDEDRLLGYVRTQLTALNKKYTASSMRVRKAALMFEPPSVNGYEITEKGYINQRAVQLRRKAIVEHLKAEESHVVRLD